MPEHFIIPTPKIGPFVLGADSQRQPGVPRGVVTAHEWRSAIFPGTVRSYWVYVPAQYTGEQPAAVMVFQDGGGYVNEEGETRVPIVFDNLIHQGKMPVTIGIFINPGVFPPVAEGKESISNRSFEYDTLSDQYARFLLEEILPAVGETYRLTENPDERAICGISSGGICSWTVAWERPDAFRKVLSHVGSFANIRGGHVYPALIRSTPAKPIRVFLQAGSNDLDVGWGDWALSNLLMASALNFMEYDYRLDYGDGAHNSLHGGAAMTDPRQRLSVLKDVVLLQLVGMHPILVHGGGPEINSMLDRLSIATTKVQGYRVTDAATMEVVEMVLSGTTNKGIVQSINTIGGNAIGLSGKDGGLLRVTKFMPGGVDIGFVGEVADVRAHVLRDLIDDGYLPVIAPIGVDEDGQGYNINADTAAAAIAGALRAEKFIMLTDVPGVLLDIHDAASLISSLSVTDAETLIDTRQISGGMIPKITACLDAIARGVARCHIIDGRQPHAMLVELFTDGGIGTMVVPDDTGEDTPEMPVVGKAPEA